jgi:hypothetical protein
LKELSKTKNNIRITGASVNIQTTHFFTLGIKGKDYLQDLDLEGSVMEMNFKNLRVWSGLIWLRIKTSGGLLWTQ